MNNTFFRLKNIFHDNHVTTISPQLNATAPGYFSHRLFKHELENRVCNLEMELQWLKIINKP